MNYIGVDCHISTLEFAVVNEFMAFVRDIPKPRKIFILLAIEENL